jgi:hypothetical protein
MNPDPGSDTVFVLFLYCNCEILGKFFILLF